MSQLPTAGAIAIDGGDLPLGGGVLALLRPALSRVEDGGIVALLSSSTTLHQDLSSWCRAERHAYLGERCLADGRYEHFIQRRSVRHVPVNGARPLEWKGEYPTTVDVVSASPFPARADGSSGFAPRGAEPEPGGRVHSFALTERDRVAPPEVAQLYDQAVSNQWSVRDIEWNKLKPQWTRLEEAVVQIMTFLAENELSALYVPSQFVSRIHPAYAETALFLATQLADEARHIDVFVKRARISSATLGISAATTSDSLLSLLDSDDFTEASFLLSVLGEGTFLNLLKFVERHAPDEPTAEIARKARLDEARHVRFGIAHVRHALACDPVLFKRLEHAVRQRSARLTDSGGGVPAPIQDALTILAARGTDPQSVRRGHEAYQALLDEMHGDRVKRLLSAGFTTEQSESLSGLHTPNFM